MIWISTMQANVVVERDFVPVSVSTNKLSDKESDSHSIEAFGTLSSPPNQSVLCLCVR